MGLILDTLQKRPNLLTAHFQALATNSVCGRSWSCIINILPLPNRLGGTRCEKRLESICSACFDSAIGGLTATELRLTLESMMQCVDPLLASQAKANGSFCETYSSE